MDKEINLDKLRVEINDIDKELIQLFERRMDIVSKVARYKKDNNLPVFDEKREEEVILRAMSYLEKEELKDTLRLFMEDLMTISRHYQIELLNISDANNLASHNKTLDSTKTVGYYGVQGSFSEEAALSYFSGDFKSVNCDAFEDVVEMLIENKIDIGVMPIENSSTGVISTVIDLIRDNDIYIVGEHKSKIKHNLLVKPGTKLTDIERVYSHPQGIEQSSKFLRQFNWLNIPHKSTAASARLVSESSDKNIAAIASKRSAQIYGLDILKENIHNNDENYTRFVMLSRELQITPNSSKISVVLEVAHKPGALYNTLRLFNERGVNIMKIESRPIIGRPWEYLFFFDFEGNLNEQRIQNLLKTLEDSCHEYRLLGNYE